MSDDRTYATPAVAEYVPKALWAEPLRSSRVPHVGHAVLFVSFAALLLFLSQLIFLEIAHTSSQLSHAVAAPVLRPRQQLLSMALTYLVTLAGCFLVFPIFWGRSFLDGIDWKGAKAVRLAPRLISLGLCVGWMVLAISTHIPVPKSMPMDDFFRTPSDIWLVTLFGTLVAPIFEEIAFRGFLLPAFAIAFDWLRAMTRHTLNFSRAHLSAQEPPRSFGVFREAASDGLASGTGNLFFRSRVAVLFASLLSSALFAMLHADQLAHAAGALYILFCVSLLLTLIRVTTRSVACSTLVHASYNFSVFLTLFLGTGGFRHLDKIAH